MHLRIIVNYNRLLGTVKKKQLIDDYLFSNVIEEENDFFPLMSDEDEEKIDKEETPKLLSILPLRNTVLFPGVIIPITIGRDRSIELIKAKIQADKDRIVANFDGNPLVQVLNGRYGVFIQITPEKGKKINVKIPKDIDPKKLSREECLDLMENQKKK